MTGGFDINPSYNLFITRLLLLESKFLIEIKNLVFILLIFIQLLLFFSFKFYYLSDSQSEVNSEVK